ncbi:flagellin [Xanthobacter sp. V4C-4]|uniref:flagellin N-terminal helical domain-containing protein n=1 Tax=Xanthobacter cornucopiae TaxID=3119924 RepID=UPI0037267CAA
MTSMITNNSATVALQTLRSINNQLETTNNRVSTGKTVNSAADGAAYWSISTTLTSDNSALSAVTDAMSLDKNAVDTTYKGVTSVLDDLTTIQSKLASAVSSSMSRSSLQDEISALQKNISTTATNTVSNGNNWLSVDSSATSFTDNRNLLSSFSRSGDTVSVGTSALDTGSFRLYDANTSNATSSTVTNALANVATNASGNAADGTAITVAVSTATGDTGGFMDTKYTIQYTDAAGTAQTVTASVGSLDVSSLTDKDANLIEAYTKLVNATLSQLQEGGSKLGSTSSRLESQQTFAKSLITLNKSSIGALVDADMEEESTRLKALQTQQSLAIQSLSIANSSSQNVLQLFQ